jgi:CheY-like chemotaxis protein
MTKSYKRIVVAEDDPGVLDLVITRLELEGYETFAARNGVEALEAVQSVDPDAVVLDIGLPGMDGFEVLKTLMAIERFQATPVLVLTARNAAGDVRRAMALGRQGLCHQAVQRDLPAVAFGSADQGFGRASNRGRAELTRTAPAESAKARHA